jgi:SPP1 gp7 family putative phage head morphogenesis protein
MKRAGTVYPYEREVAMRRNYDVTYITDLGKRTTNRYLSQFQAEVIRAYQSGGNIPRVVKRFEEQIHDVIVQAMVIAKLKGIERAAKEADVVPAQFFDAGGVTIAAARSPAYSRAVRYLLGRLKLSPEQLARIETSVSAEVTRVLATSTLSIQRELMKEIALITKNRMHVREGVQALREKFQSLNLTPRSPSQMEAIVRTQTQLAYAAGNGELLADPDIESALWGYKYVTAGDDRVRSSHIAMDGVTLPKDDPFWLKNKPPNGWNCRCQIIPIFRERRIVRPPDSVIDKTGGKDKPVSVEADKGFGFDPAKLFSAT